MAKRSNNSLGRRAYGGKPYDANNSFVKKMANKVTDFIPQRSWISKWFNASQDNGDASACEGENHNDVETEEDARQPPAKRPRIRMDVTHPPGTFFIRPRDRDSSNENDSRKDPFSRSNETEPDFLEPAMAGPSGLGRFISSTPAVQTDIRNTNIQRADLNCLIPSENNGTTNGADDNSESSESTSGCSSLIPQTNRQEGTMNAAYHTNLSNRKRLIDDKTAFGNHLQSPRCLFLDSNNRESLSSRRPSFNASMMNSNNTLDRASSLSSPFYAGNVTFGGANALGHYKRSRSLFNSTNEFQLKVPRRTSVQVKPSNTECIDASGMSQTAKRILEAMEYFSSPISDAKKIPVKKIDAATIGGRKRSREEQQAVTPTARVGLRHLTRELAVPTIPEMLKLRRRQKLQDTTVAARKIVSAMSGPPPGSTSTVTSKPATEEYQLRTETDQEPVYRGKLRATSKNNANEVEPIPSVNLPRISLAITSLPTFEPLPKYTKPTSRETVDVSKEKDTSTTYKFASPIKLSEAAWNLKSINNFSFSKPIIADGKDDSRESNVAETTTNTSSSVSSPSAASSLRSTYMGLQMSGFNANSSGDGAAKNFMWTGSSTAPRLKVKTKPDKDSGKGSKSPILASELRFGSVMDILGGKHSPGKGTESQKTSPRASNFVNPSKSLVNIWECAECYIKNDSSEKLCVACKAAKPSATTEKVSSPANTVQSNIGTSASQQPRDIASSSDCFGTQFKMNTNQWECTSCLVRNKQVDLVCVSCTTPKPNNTVPTSNAVGTASNQSTGKSDLMDKFKPAENSWECPGCMLRNPGTIITCPCCNASKPSLLNIGPKKPSNESNANDKTNKSSELVDKFKPSSSSWECSSCLVRNAETASACVCCSNPKPDSSSKASSDNSSTTTKSAASPNFTTTSGWGDKFKKPEGAWSCDSCMVQNKAEVTECVACGGVKAGATKSSPKAAESTFTFGIPANAQNSINATKTETGSSNGFSFGVKSSAADAKPAGGFTFGMPSSETEKNKIASTTEEKPTGFVFATPKSAGPTWGTGFKFGAPTNASETSDSAKSSTDSQEKKETFSFGLPTSVSAPVATDEKETIFGSSSGIGNGKSVSVFGGDANKVGANATTTNTTFGVTANDKSIAKSTVFGGEVSQATSNNETKSEADNSTKSSNSESDKRPATITTDSSTSANSNPSLTATTSTAFSTETRSSFTFSEPSSKLTSQPSISSGFGETSMSAPAPVTSSTFSMAASKTSGANLNSDNKQTTMNTFGANTVAPMTSPFGTPNSSASPLPALAELSGANQTTPLFGTNSTKPSFFALPADKKPSTFGTVENKTPMFGSVDNKPTPPPTFDSTEKSTSNSIFNNSNFSDGFSTGAARPAQPAIFGSTTTPVFGNTSVPSFGTPTTAATSNIFGTAKPNVTSSAPSSTGLFTFGAATPQTSTTSASGGFNFSANATPASSAAKPIFAFGGTAPQTNECFTGTNANVGGTFGTSATINPAPSPFTFNAPAKQDPPTFGQTTTALPSMFGTQPTAPSIGQSQPASTFLSNPPAASTGFNFGASSQPANSGGFNFGANMTQQSQQQPASASSSGFNFNAAAPPAFDPNTPLSFNFTGGSAPTAFNATPQQPAQARRIKKAVRRMPQR